MKKRKLLALLLIAISFFAGYELYSSKFMLTTSYYIISSCRLEKMIRIVQLADLHNSEFGTGNERLINKVIEQNPDLILVTGDMVDSYSKNTEIAMALIERLSEIAPVYSSLGNHEKEYEENYGIDIRVLFENAGAIVLDDMYMDIVINNQAVRIGGGFGYYLPKDYESARENENAFLENFESTDSLKILLAHMPLAWYYSGSLESWNVDIVFSGHTHGGQVRIPFIGGLYAPDRGWFPGREAGLYYSDAGDKVLVLSRGLGSTKEKVPRVNNIPEIVVVDVVPANLE